MSSDHPFCECWDARLERFVHMLHQPRIRIEPPGRVQPHTEGHPVFRFLNTTGQTIPAGTPIFVGIDPAVDYSREFEFVRVVRR